MIKIINEGIFSTIADSLGMGALWGVIKSRFWQFVRGWTAIIDIWKADSVEQIEEAKKSYREDIENIKGRYRSAEDEFDRENGLFNSAYGSNLLFMNPGLALTSALVEPLMNQEYRADTRRLMADTGISRWGLTPSFVSNWIEGDPNKERVAGRTISYGPDGKTRKTDIILFDKKDDSTNKSQKMEDMIGLFVESADKNQNLLEQEERFSKKDAEAMAARIVQAFEDQGILKNFQDVAAELTKRKEEIIAEVVEPSARTIELISKMMSAESPEQFVSFMQEASQANDSLKSLDPGAFVSEIDNSVASIMSNPAQLQALKDETGSEDVSEVELRSIVFEMLRNNFSNGIINTLESVYESTIETLMEGTTEDGLKKARETAVGAEYANLIQTNIQKLENAIKSLDKLEKKQEK